jgi:hypothetical protein
MQRGREQISVGQWREFRQRGLATLLQRRMEKLALLREHSPRLAGLYLRHPRTIDGIAFKELEEILRNTPASELDIAIRTFVEKKRAAKRMRRAYSQR